jgi:hypothetical protein
VTGPSEVPLANCGRQKRELTRIGDDSAPTTSQRAGDEPTFGNSESTRYSSSAFCAGGTILHGHNEIDEEPVEFGSSSMVQAVASG